MNVGVYLLYVSVVMLVLLVGSNVGNVWIVVWLLVIGSMCVGLGVW